MKKNVFGRKFKRDKNERQALFKSLISSLILKERIQTTEQKAKAIKGDVDKIVTKVKKNQEEAKRLLGDLVTPQALQKLIKDIAPRFAKRAGGYTRIIRMGKRFGDDAMMVLMEWTEGPLPAEPKIKNQKSKIKNTTQKLKVKKTRRSVASQSGSRSSQNKKGSK